MLEWPARADRREYRSSMCSTAGEAERRIAEIGRAIEDLAADARAVAERRDGAGDSGHVVTRLAELWALLAELDPDIARRLPTYQLD